jgi:hypothetical protein
MKSLVLLTFLSLSPGEPTTTGKVEFFDNEAACQVRMDQIRTQYSAPASARCSCKKIVPPVNAEGNDAI